ncbi:MAG: type III pantothenate kinase [Candidatus Omnitrophica bacterium]|nr:type III pantothenate kinase [Candidatus Omnitrophota bacterium]
MLFAVDIGNSNITCALFSGSTLKKRFNIPTKSKNYSALFKKYLLKIDIKGVIISSVVPDVTPKVSLSLKKFKNVPVLICGKNISVPIKNLYHPPHKVGQDRLVNAFAACQLYGYPVITVDVGTAITLDVVSKRKEYLGGMILPGLEMSLQALAEKTALLPKVKLRLPRRIIGTSTQESIISGIVIGYTCLIDGLIKKIKKEIGNSKVVLTGGQSKFLSCLSEEAKIIDPNLTVKGLYCIAKYYQIP